MLRLLFAAGPVIAADATSVVVTCRPNAIERPFGVIGEGGLPLFSLGEDLIKVSVELDRIGVRLAQPTRAFELSVFLQGDGRLVAEAFMDAYGDVSTTVTPPDVRSFLDTGGSIDLRPAGDGKGTDAVLHARVFAHRFSSEGMVPLSMVATILVPNLRARSPQIWEHIAVGYESVALPQRVKYKNQANGTTSGWVDERGWRYGLWRHLDASGNLIIEETYEDGERNGAWYECYPRDRMRIGFYKANRIDGVWVTQSVEDRRVTVLEQYNNGNKAGVYREYAANGLPICIGQFKEGRATGEWTWWSSEGALTERIQY